MQQERTGYFEPTAQQYQYRIFINECNAYIGSQLVEVFRNDDQIEVNPNIIASTLHPTQRTIGQTPANTIIDPTNRPQWNAVLKSSDIIVYLLTNNNARDFEYLLKFLRKTKHEGPKSKKLICISSFLTWNGKRTNHEIKPSIDNLSNRNSSQSYLIELENLCLDINNLSLNMEASVVCSGLAYGYGQGELFPYFKKALEQEESLKIYGTGSNHIPMIHVEDLCSIVKNIAFSVGGIKRDQVPTPKPQYYFAIDHAKLTQHDIVKCISQNLGNGQFQKVPIENGFLSTNFDLITIDLTISDLPTLQNWHMKAGFTASIEKIVSQFNLYRGLKPNKIFITGPPAAGKSKIAEFLEKSYGLPVLTVKKVLDQIQNQEGQFANQIKIKLEQIRAQKIEEEKKVFEQAKKKKKGKKDAADEFDPSKIVPRLPQDLLIQVFKKRLTRSDCLNKGYILDGWPKTAKSCEGLFTNEKKQIQQAIFPNSAFSIAATQQEVKERVKGLPQTIKESTHFNEQSTVRRFQAHSKANEEGLPKIFLNGKVQIQDVPFVYQNSQQFIQFIERNGPLGFKKKEKAKPDQKGSENKIEDENKNQGEPEENLENQEEEQKQVEVEEGQFDLEKLSEHEKQILNEKSRPIRQYLIDNVIPQITEGLLEICKQTPREPISFLIKFLENKELLKKKKAEK